MILDMNTKKLEEEFSEQETERRRDELAKQMLNTPPKPLKPKSKEGMKANPPKKRDDRKKIN